MTSKAALWRGRITEWKASGKTSEQFCEGKDFSAGALRHWVYRFKRQAEAAAPTAVGPTVRVARVVRAKPAPSPPEPLVVEIGGARVFVRPGYDLATLAVLIELLAPSDRDTP